MNHIRRIAVILVGHAAAVLALAAAPPAALAVRVPPPGGSGVPTQASHRVQAIVTGGMPGWQIALIAAGAALAAAVIAVMLDRARTARRRVTRAAT